MKKMAPLKTWCIFLDKICSRVVVALIPAFFFVSLFGEFVLDPRKDDQNDALRKTIHIIFFGVCFVFYMVVLLSIRPLLLIIPLVVISSLIAFVDPVFIAVDHLMVAIKLVLMWVTVLFMTCVVPISFCITAFEKVSDYLKDLWNESIEESQQSEASIEIDIPKDEDEETPEAKSINIVP